MEIEKELIIPQKVFDKYFVQEIKIEAEGVDMPAKAIISVVPFSSSDKEPYYGEKKVLRIDDVSGSEMSGPLQDFLAAVAKLIL